MNSNAWQPVSTNVFPPIEETVEISYRACSPYEAPFWNIRTAVYLGDGIFMLWQSGKHLRKAVSAWRYMEKEEPYIPEDWNYSADCDNWYELED